MDQRTNLKISATKLLRKGGYSSFSFRDLAEKAGIKSSSVHYYFPTKADLIEEVTKDYTIAFIERLKTQSEKFSSPEKKVEILIQLYEESLTADLNCLCGVLASEIDLLSAKERGAVMDFFNQIEKWLRSVIVDHKRMSGPEIVHMLMSALNGALVLDRTFDSKKRFASVKAFAEMVL